MNRIIVQEDNVIKIQYASQFIYDKKEFERWASIHQDLFINETNKNEEGFEPRTITEEDRIFMKSVESSNCEKHFTVQKIKIISTKEIDLSRLSNKIELSAVELSELMYQITELQKNEIISKAAAFKEVYDNF